MQLGHGTVLAANAAVSQNRRRKATGQDAPEWLPEVPSELERPGCELDEATRGGHCKGWGSNASRSRGRQDTLGGAIFPSCHAKGLRAVSC